MKTSIYMVRHAESPYDEGDERTRGLTVQGKEEAGTCQVANRMRTVRADPLRCSKLY